MTAEFLRFDLGAKSSSPAGKADHEPIPGGVLPVLAHRAALDDRRPQRSDRERAARTCCPSRGFREPRPVDDRPASPEAPGSLRVHRVRSPSLEEGAPERTLRSGVRMHAVRDRAKRSLGSCRLPVATVRIGRPLRSGGAETAAVMRMRTQRCGRATALLRAVRIGSHDARTGRSKRPRTQGCATLTVASRAEGSGRHASDPDVRPSSSGSADGCRLREQSVRTRHAAPRAMLAGMRESRATEKGTPRAEFSFQRTQHGASRLARRRPTLPLTYASSTIGSGGLDFRVRDGIG